MHPILFSIGQINFYSYGFFASLAFIAGYLVIHQINKKEGKNTDKLIDQILLVFMIGIIVSRLAYFFVYFNQFSHWWEVFYIWQGGLISYGGLIGGLATYVLIFKKNLIHNLDILALGFLISDFFWRIGCTFAGDHPTLVSSEWYAINGHLPAPLFEGIGGLIGFSILWYLFTKIAAKPGIIFSITLLYYGLVRLIVDQWRIDPMIGNLTSGQFTGIIMMIIGALAFFSMILYDKARLQIHRLYKLHK